MLSGVMEFEGRDKVGRRRGGREGNDLNGQEGGCLNCTDWASLGLTKSSNLQGTTASPRVHCWNQHPIRELQILWEDRSCVWLLLGQHCKTCLL